MRFADSSILWALAALAIPLVIHVAGRRGARRLVLPTARFADAAHRDARARVWLKRLTLLAVRAAAVALAVLAVARPLLVTGRQLQAGAASESAAVRPASSDLGDTPPSSPRLDETGRAAQSTPEGGRAPQAPPLGILVVDGADEKDAPVRTADLVAAALGGDPRRKTVTRADGRHVTGPMLQAADVVFWIGAATPDDEAGYHRFLGQCRMVWIPPAADPAEEAGRMRWPQGPSHGILAPPPAKGPEDLPDGVTLDPAGYTSDLLAAFENGTSGDLSAPVLNRRLMPAESVLAATRGAAVRFRDGSPAILDSRDGAGRVVCLMFGPAPSWGDLAGRAEFVVLMHSLAEALAPEAARALRGNAPADQAVTPLSHAARPPVPGGHLDTVPPRPDRAGGAMQRSSGSPAIMDLSAWPMAALAAALSLEGLLSACFAPRPRHSAR
jgi:hypothetical protein